MQDNGNVRGTSRKCQVLSCKNVTLLRFHFENRLAQSSLRTPNSFVWLCYERLPMQSRRAAVDADVAESYSEAGDSQRSQRLDATNRNAESMPEKKCFSISRTTSFGRLPAVTNKNHQILPFLTPNEVSLLIQTRAGPLSQKANRNGESSERVKTFVIFIFVFVFVLVRRNNAQREILLTAAPSESRLFERWARSESRRTSSALGKARRAGPSRGLLPGLSRGSLVE